MHVYNFLELLASNDYCCFRLLSSPRGRICFDQAIFILVPPINLAKYSIVV